MAALQNPRHELFAQGVVEGKSADASYTDAGYKSQRQNASRLMANDDVKARIRELQDRGLKRHDLSVDKILEGFAKIAFSDIRLMIDEHGSFIKPKDLPDDIVGALSSLKVQDGKIVAFKLGDRCAALVNLGKHFNIFEADKTVKAEVTHKEVSNLEVARRIAWILASGAEEARVAEEAEAAKGGTRMPSQIDELLDKVSATPSSAQSI